MKIMVLILVSTLLTACGGAWMYSPQSGQEAIDMIKATGSSGCFYLRGNARPYADVSTMFVGTYGADAPKWDRCLEMIPAEARAFIRQGM